MKPLSLNKIEAIYEKAKLKALNLCEKGDYTASIKYIKLCAKIAYAVSFKYVDNELDKLLSIILSKTIIIKSAPAIKNRVVFYDYYPNDGKGLSQQYLSALIDNNIEFLYIIENYVPSKTHDIISAISDYPKGELLILDNRLNDIEKAQVAYGEIMKFSPEKALLHFLPWDVTGCLIFSQMKSVKRYMINLTDHAFWLGKNCFDYLIEFREYGANLSLQERGVIHSAQILLPYYPIFKRTNFKGFDFHKKQDYVYFLTGGAFYKTFGDNYKFYRLLKRILIENPKLVILFAGDGDNKYISNFIISNKLENRLLLLGYRNDLSSVMENVDGYIATYPIGGGLIHQFACMAQKPIVAYVNRKNPSNYPESTLYNLSSDVKLSFDTDDEFSNEISKLVRDDSYRAKRGNETANKIISREEFGLLVQKYIIGDTEPKFEFKRYDIDINHRINLYLQIENTNFHFIPKAILKTLKFNSIKFAPIIMISYIVSNFGFLISKICK